MSSLLNSWYSQQCYTFYDIIKYTLILALTKMGTKTINKSNKMWFSSKSLDIKLNIYIYAFLSTIDYASELCMKHLPGLNSSRIIRLQCIINDNSFFHNYCSYNINCKFNVKWNHQNHNQIIIRYSMRNLRHTYTTVFVIRMQ